MRAFPEWWEFLEYGGLKSCVNVSEGLKDFSGERIKVDNEEDDTNTLNKSYEKLQAKKDRVQRIQTLDMIHSKVHFQINQ